MKNHFRPPKWIFLFALTILAAQLFGQNTNKSTQSKPVYRYGLKAYLNVSHENKIDTYTDNVLYRTTETTQKTTDFSPTIGFSKNKKKGKFYEISFTHFNFNKDDAVTYHRIDTANTIDIPSRGAKNFTAHVGLRYEWDFPVFYEKLGRFQPYIGISTDPSVYFLKSDPYTSATFPTTIAEANNTISLIPRLVFNASSRLFFDINLPVSVFSTSVSYRYYGNPILTTYARRTTELSSQFLPTQFNMRLGVGYRI